jgi:serine/threonine-protein kinase RsbW/sigma-B regulation protein RsbU (phosphoserine phosphatase)
MYEHGVGVDPDRLTLRLTNRLSEIPRSAELVQAFCARQGVASSAIFAINVALEELLANTMSYGYVDDREHEIVVQIWREDADLVIDIADDARPFDPTQVAPPDLDAPLDERPVGGLGIHLVRNMMDRMDYRGDGQHNRVRLRKRIAPSPAPG